MERKTLKDLRILIVGGKPHAVATLRMAFGIVGFANVEAVAKSARAVEILSSRSVDAVFCDECAAPLDGVPFPQAARRIKGVLDPMVPIFLICDAPKRRHVERARDVGVTNVLVRPISAATVVRKLRLAMAAPRPFILAGDFFGPDRR
ncbi:MAG: response regulator, partial [Alphaproteobacteria bacterium]|nr:response regulator [Alphaproteobacteria bacterium]